ncbi:M48 family metallopeptidase [Lawsonia intracellularis]|uniref:Predicted metal dependent hydrolases n=1 Tax=Lawsonia intracellularis (strain PHE/MN1-00) TaxID=363253 RepID=Q1MQS1_LAWIP|nr:SprT family zinc-dependent metalloprotease [Lawsonia intracellularis]AGC50019.1 hypothetical protein LAW_00621 [Lawsonia intracellularis N343]KAA0204716.1 M48 family peptidase [Lawsonia intracellularis]MBZ3893083.1 M48 family metallopeptidase [Lawsonia intracellularis]OMQ04454.1 hydrolase [Lawsonia intracellularis]RBN33371.1 M48 family peptidase [Lawsonia intracellularis]
MKETLHNYTFTTGEKITVIVKKGSPRRKHIAICITSRGQVVITIPYGVMQKDALQIINKKENWIKHHLIKTLNKPQPSPLTYTTGESHLYLGKRYSLIVLKEKKSRLSLQQRIILNKNEIQVTPFSNNSLTVKRLLFKWYYAEAQQYIAKQLYLLLQQIPWLQTVPTWKIKAMRCCWGSCSPHGVITINTHLIKAPTICINYVLLHEIAHLKEHNHSHNYYKLLTKLMPNWINIKTQLENIAPFVLMS